MEHTDQFIKDNEDLIKSLGKKLADDIKAAKEDGNETPPAELQLKMERMVADQMKAQNIVAPARRKGQFDEEYAKSALFNDDNEEKAIKQIETMSLKNRLHHQETKMLSAESHLETRHGKSLSDKIETFKRLNDDAHLISTMLHLAQAKNNAHGNYMDIYRGTDAYKDVHRMLAQDSELRKAMAVANSGQGAEWIPTGFSSQVLKTIELNLQVSALFPQIALPTNPYKLPVQISNATGYLIPENTADEGTKHKASTAGTSSPSFNAIKLAGRTTFSEEISEDSIVNVRDFTMQELAKAIARAEETAIINGDAGTAAAHQDNQTADLFTDSKDARLAFNGLRYFALNNAGTSTKSFSAADPSDALMGAVRLLAGKYGVHPSDNAWVVGVNTYLKMLYNLTNVTTLEKYGPQATVLAGELFRYMNIPVIVSEYLFENINASGVYDGATTNLTSLLLVNRPSFIKGTRGGVTLNSDLNIETDQIVLVAKRRMDFVDPYDATLAANRQCVGGINIKTA